MKRHTFEVPVIIDPAGKKYCESLTHLCAFLYSKRCFMHGCWGTPVDRGIDISPNNPPVLKTSRGYCLRSQECLATDCPSLRDLFGRDTLTANEERCEAWLRLHPFMKGHYHIAKQLAALIVAENHPEDDPDISDKFMKFLQDARVGEEFEEMISEEMIQFWGKVFCCNTRQVELHPSLILYDLQTHKQMIPPPVLSGKGC